MKREVQNTKLEKSNTSKGITLIALVITIIVLLILAGVAISMAINSDGLFSKANEAAEKWNTAVADDKQALDEILYTLDKHTEATDIYVTLYNDGVLAFNDTEETIEGKTVAKSYGNIKGKEYTYKSNTPWYDDKANITSVTIVNEIKPTSTEAWFYNCSEITTMDLENLNTSLVTEMNEMFCGCKKLASIDVSNFNTSRVKDMSWMFQELDSITSIDVSNFDTSNAINMAGMFYYCKNLTEIIGLENFDTSKAENMSYMFQNLFKLESLDLNSFDTRNVTDMAQMFYNLNKVTKIEGLEKFNTSKVTNMKYMFFGCAGFTSLNVSNFDTSKVTDMEQMFAYNTEVHDSQLTEIVGLEKFDTSKVTNMIAMFRNCDKITSLDLSSFDISEVTSMKQMFQNCTLLENIYVGEGWTYKEGVNKTGMFTNCKATDVTKTTETT